MSETPAIAEQDIGTDPERDDVVLWALTEQSARLRRLEYAAVLLLIAQSPQVITSLLQ